MSKTKQELFDVQAHIYGCGYYKSCWEHSCPCNISIKCDGIYSEEIDNALKEEAQKVVEDLEKELDDFDINDFLNDDDYNSHEDHEDEECIK